MRLFGWMALLVSFHGYACSSDDGAGSEAADAKPAAIDMEPVADMADTREDAAPPAPDASPASRLTDFCDAFARAKCEWADGCGGIRYQLALSGNSVLTCVEAEQGECTEDVLDRLERGTIDRDALNDDAVADCVNGVASLPCLESHVSEWAENWRSRVHDLCRPPVRGNVGDGGACERRTDCQQAFHICAEGTCRQAVAGDLLQTCEASSSPTRSTPDPSCPGLICIGALENDVGVVGVCGIDCADGQGCPPGDACLERDFGASAEWHCIKTCQRDSECGGDELVCVVINAVDPGSKYCRTPVPEEADAGAQ